MTVAALDYYDPPDPDDHADDYDASPEALRNCWEYIADTQPAHLFPAAAQHFDGDPATASTSDVWDRMLDLQPEIPEAWQWYWHRSQYRTDLDTWNANREGR